VHDGGIRGAQGRSKRDYGTMTSSPSSSFSSSSSLSSSYAYCIVCGDRFAAFRFMARHLVQFHTRAMPCLYCKNTYFGDRPSRKRHYQEKHHCDVPTQQQNEPDIQYKELPEVKAILDRFGGDVRAAGLAAKAKTDKGLRYAQRSNRQPASSSAKSAPTAHTVAAASSPLSRPTELAASHLHDEGLVDAEYINDAPFITRPTGYTASSTLLPSMPSTAAS